MVSVLLPKHEWRCIDAMLGPETPRALFPVAMLSLFVPGLSPVQLFIPSVVAPALDVMYMGSTATMEGGSAVQPNQMGLERLMMPLTSKDFVGTASLEVHHLKVVL